MYRKYKGNNYTIIIIINNYTIIINININKYEYNNKYK